MRVLMLTSVWPTPERPELAPFLVRQVNFLRKAGVSVDVFPVQGHMRPDAYLRAWQKVRKLMRRRAWDLVHAQWAQSALTCLPTRLPLVVTFHGSDVQGIPGRKHRRTLPGWVLQRVARAVARVASEAIVVAERMVDLLPRREYHVIPCGVDLELFRPCPRDEARARLGLNPAGRYILFAANPARPVKRYSLARAAVDSLDAGQAAELMVTSGVDPNMMPLYMNACDALLLTSVHEGSPTVVKEALACNLPVVSTDVGDVAERIRDVEGCELCDSQPQALAGALGRVLDAGRRVSGRNAVKQLDESLLTRRVIGVYESALRRREPIRIQPARESNDCI